MKLNSSQKDQLPIIVLRVILSIIIMSHGGHRLFTGGSVHFGTYLESQGIPLGTLVAWFITFAEFFAAPLFAIGKYVVYIASIYFAIVFTGILMVHISSGWFVVGSGSNGAEYSVLICAALFSIGYSDYTHSKNNS